jgi:hypothetical protein
MPHPVPHPVPHTVTHTVPYKKAPTMAHGWPHDDGGI